MKRDVLDFLKRERDALAEELARLQHGERKVVQLDGGEQDITGRAAADLEARLLRFEEFIAAAEAGLF